MKKHPVLLTLLLLFVFCLPLYSIDRWSINPDGSISWFVKENIPHDDHIEMSGLKVSTVLRYGVDEKGAFHLNRSMVWPMLRTIPNDTHGSLMRRFAWNIVNMVSVDRQSLVNERVTEISLKGLMTVKSIYDLPTGASIEMTRILFPSVQYPAFCEKYIMKNIGQSVIQLEVPETNSVVNTDVMQGVDGSYRLISTLKGCGVVQLSPQQEVSFDVTFAGYKAEESEININVDGELKAREELIAGLWENLVLETPDPVINAMFAFAKIRGAESIYDTQGGLFHGPGGEAYYAAIWANDQAEYINPFFPFLGYANGDRSAMDSFRHFARFMNSEYKPMPSSIIAEGLDIWNGAGDRGDAAMVAYGAARYALAKGSKEEAEEVWSLIEWCLEYCRRNLNEHGVVMSDSDELENRFPSGDANLCTSSLYYDALLSASYLGKELGKPSSQVSQYRKQAVNLYKDIETYFGAEVEGFNTYQYYQGNDILRSWIAIPLTVGIYERKDETIRALFSPRLWSDDGLLTQAGSETFWDRSTLYALRGVYACGETSKATDYLKSYSRQRLLGEHVPYAIEAWPEGSQRHLSAESGLYCRIITEGMFGIRPIGLRSFMFTPRMPEEWEYMRLKNIRAFGCNFNVEISRQGDNLLVNINSGGRNIVKRKIKDGESFNVKL